MTTSSPAAFAAHLITEFCVPVITGSVQGQSPLQGAELDDAQRAQLNLPAGGRTFAYRVGDSIVTLDLSGNRSQLWFDDEFSEVTRGTIEKAVLAKWPHFKPVLDIKSSSNNVQRLILQGDLPGNKIAQVDMLYPPDSLSGPKQFAVRVHALLKTGNAPSDAPFPAWSAPPSLGAPGNKGWN